MKKTYAKLMTAVLAAASILPAVPTAADETAESTLNVAIGSQFTTFDPALNTETANNYVLNHLYAGMFRKDADGKVQNELCESYEVSDDGLTYTFHISPDAKWSDGQQVMANDFVYSYLRALSYGADNAWAINDFVNFIEGAEEYSTAAQEEGESFDCTTADHSLVGIEAADDQTLVLKLKAPCAYLTGLMCANAWLPVREDFAVQHDSLWAFEGDYPTTGPYTLTECNETEKAVVDKNENYLNADDVTMDEITFLCMADKDAQALAYQTGEIDVALGISTDTALNYEGTDELWMLPKSSNYYLAINSAETGPEWAKNVDVRRALALAIDKESLVDVLGGDSFYPVLNGFVPDGVAGDTDTFRAEGDADGYTLTYDPDQAKELLAGAGYDESNPLHITYKYSNNGIHGDVATMLQQMWEAVGVEVDFECVESGVYYDQLDQGDFEICRYGYSAEDSPIQFLEMWTTGMQVVPAVNDEKFDQMIEDARQISDRSEYMKALHEAEDYLVEENVYVIPLFNFNDPALVQTYVEGQTMNGIYPYFAYTTVTE